MWHFFTCFSVVFLAIINPNDSADTRIIGGVKVTKSWYPYLASLQVDGGHVCGAAIVNPNILISAAHCIRFKASAYSVRVGSLRSDSGGKLYPVQRIELHTNYSRRTSDSDLCVIYLNDTINYDVTASPVKLPAVGETLPFGQMAVVAGWGTTNAQDAGEISPDLKMASLFVADQNTCVDIYPPTAISKNMFCAGSPIGDDACTGDSGGPLVFAGRLIGVVSWGFGCGDRNYPGVFANVANLMPFISKHVNVSANPYVPTEPMFVGNGLHRFS